MTDTEKISVEVFTTNRGGKKLYIEGYTYAKVSTTKNYYYWICELRDDPKHHCKVTVKTLYNGDIHTLSSAPKEHNHSPDPLRKKVADFKQKLKEKSLTNKKLCKILKDTKNEISSDVLDNLPSTSALIQSMYRKKRKLLSKIEEPDPLNFEVHENITNLENKVSNNESVFNKNTTNFMSTLNSMLGSSNGDEYSPQASERGESGFIEDSENNAESQSQIIPINNKRKYITQIELMDDTSTENQDSSNIKKIKIETADEDDDANNKCTHCSSDKKVDNRNFYFGNLLIGELQFVPPCMRSEVYINILNYIEKFKHKHKEN